jgi:Fur family transcriptional regulator, ferric uptake regulator
MRISLIPILSLILDTVQVMASLDWIRYVYADLQMGGFNRGGARDAVIDLLGDQECALSAAEIEGRLRGQGRPIARASIYRVLDLLVARGLAERVSVGQGEALFEPLEPSGEHHHHLFCGQCGRLIPFDDPGLERAIDDLEDRLGVTVDSHDVLLRGACEQCR